MSRASSSLEQQQLEPRCRGSGQTRIGLEPIHAGATEVVQRSGLRRGHQLERRIESAGLQARLGGGQRAVGPSRGLLGQRDRALQKGGRSGKTTASLRSTSRPLELGGHGVVGAERGLRAVPGTTIRVDRDR